MKIAVPKETDSRETRVAMSPESARRLVDGGGCVMVQRGAGARAGLIDADYKAAGAELADDMTELAREANVILSVRRPPKALTDACTSGTLLVGLLDPFHDDGWPAELAGRGLDAIAMELVPRITRAQKMDALSSQANLAGYVAVVIAAEQLNRIFPMMMTAAGTIPPARVFVIGAGVAGLQAIATAKRLGARVEAYDTRPEVAEQVKSVGGKFVEIDLGETGRTQDGYARALTEAQVARQREAMAAVCARSEVVITTAQVFGGRAPLLVTEAMLDGMRPGGVVVDLAVESGGNVAGIRLDAIIERRGVRLVGLANLPGRVPAHASQVYAANLTALVEEFRDAATGRIELPPEDEILKGCLWVRGGKIVNERFKS
jgi:NAD(P) transhydrogenase subunit alpha